MAKKVKKATKTVKKVKKASVKSVPEIKQEMPVKKGPGIVTVAFIAVLIAAGAIAAAVIYSNVAGSKQAAAATPVTVNTVVAAPVPVNTVQGNVQKLNIKDSKSGKIVSIPIKPASASSSNTIVAAVPPAAAVAPAAVPTSADIAERCKKYFNDVATKETINRIDIEDAEYLYNSGKALFIDARGVNEYNEAHIKGAISLPAGSPQDMVTKLKDQLKDKVLVTYCHGVGCHLSDKSAYLLYDSGYRKVAIFFGGWPKWNEHKMPVDRK
jgi:rhodanese-related sulfurtransferase